MEKIMVLYYDENGVNKKKSEELKGDIFGLHQKRIEKTNKKYQGRRSSDERASNCSARPTSPRRVEGEACGDNVGADF